MGLDAHHPTLGSMLSCPAASPIASPPCLPCPPHHSVALRTAAESLVDRELAAMRAATGLTDERVNAVAARNQQLLAALGFGQGTLAADLMDDDDEDDELLPSPGAGGVLGERRFSGRQKSRVSWPVFSQLENTGHVLPCRPCFGPRLHS